MTTRETGTVFRLPRFLLCRGDPIWCCAPTSWDEWPCRPRGRTP